MTYSPTLETIRAKMRRGDGTGSLFAADEMAVALVHITAAEQEIARLQGEVAALREALDSALERWIPMAKVVPGGWEILLTWQERNVKALAPRRG